MELPEYESSAMGHGTINKTMLAVVTNTKNKTTGTSSTSTSTSSSPRHVHTNATATAHAPPPPPPTPPRKRKADALGRLEQQHIHTTNKQPHQSQQPSNFLGGRGATTGWTTCPLCVGSSQKKFALGRGIATHLHAVHTPWNPGKAERRKRKRMEQRRLCEARRHDERRAAVVVPVLVGSEQQVGVESSHTDLAPSLSLSSVLSSGKPTFEDQQTWDEQVLKIMAQLEETAYRQQQQHQQYDNTNISYATNIYNNEEEEDDAFPNTTNNQNNTKTNNKTHPINDNDNKNKSSVLIFAKGLDRNGNRAHSYRKSLPPFLQAAADGQLEKIKRFVSQPQKQTKESDANTEIGRRRLEKDPTAPVAAGSIDFLLDTRDRNGSTAEHWAAGEGHLTCLRYLWNLRKQRNHTKQAAAAAAASGGSAATAALPPKKIRRRDGKTCLHYAARNGRLECIQFILEDNGNDGYGSHANGDDDGGCNNAPANNAKDSEDSTKAGPHAQIHTRRHPLTKAQKVLVNEPSGDGTTPLHLACFGGHLEAVRLLLSYGANPMETNEWGCGAAHWVGMTKCSDVIQTRELCNLFLAKQVCFVTAQKQGHTPLHKAAQRHNRHVIEWMQQSIEQGGAGLSAEELKQVGQRDQGGHTPSDIWYSLGGDDSFGNWMKEVGW